MCTHNSQKFFIKKSTLCKNCIVFPKYPCIFHTHHYFKPALRQEVKKTCMLGLYVECPCMPRYIAYIVGSRPKPFMLHFILFPIKASKVLKLAQVSIDIQGDLAYTTLV